MNDKNIVFVMICILFFLSFSFLFGLEFHNSCKINQLIKRQSEINAKTCEADNRQDKELRLLRQDVEINQNILISKDYLQYGD